MIEANITEKVQSLYPGIRTKELITPSGYSVLIREQNGEDDEILSSETAQGKENRKYNNFIKAIILYSEKVGQQNLTLEHILDMRLRDKYFILISSRIFSLGPILKFQYQWDKEKDPIAYEEDLSIYTWDYTKPFPEVGNEDYHKYKIKPYYNDDKYRELTLSTGKLIRYKYLDGHGENKLLSIGINNININTELQARNIELGSEGSWFSIDSFKHFTSKEMREIRADVNFNDPDFSGVTDIEDPITARTQQVPLLNIPDFLFPREI